MANYNDSYDAEDGLGGGAEEESSGCSSWVWIIIGVIVVAVIIVVIVVCCRKKKKNDPTFGVPKKGKLNDKNCVKFYEAFEKDLAKLRTSVREQVKKVRADPKSGTVTAEQKKELLKDLQKDIEEATKLFENARKVNERVPDAFGPKKAFEAVLAKGDEELKVLSAIVDEKDVNKFFTDLGDAETKLATLGTEFEALNATLTTEIAAARPEKKSKKGKKDD
jgi:polyhydroxyalkanoate synthesis regulator phasin